MAKFLLKKDILNYFLSTPNTGTTSSNQVVSSDQNTSFIGSTISIVLTLLFCFCMKQCAYIEKQRHKFRSTILTKWKY